MRESSRSIISSRLIGISTTLGGMAELARRIPLMEFIDHGAHVQPSRRRMTSYSTHIHNSTVMRSTRSQGPARQFLSEMDVTVVTSARQMIKAALAGWDFTPKPEDRVSQHDRTAGGRDGQRIRKGGEPPVMKVIYSSHGLEDLWQLHFSELSGQKYNAAGIFIANTPDNVDCFDAKEKARSSPGPSHNGTAYWIKISATPDGSLTVFNGRTGFAKIYIVHER